MTKKQRGNALNNTKTEAAERKSVYSSNVDNQQGIIDILGIIEITKVEKPIGELLGRFGRVRLEVNGGPDAPDHIYPPGFLFHRKLLLINYKLVTHPTATAGTPWKC